MKNIINKFKLGLFISVIMVLFGCDKKEVNLPWEGEWARTINVPFKTQGRCVNERLTINNKKWNLTIVVNMTNQCNKPILELSYEGIIHEVKIKRETVEKDIRLQVSDIHLIGMVDVAGEDRTEIPQETIKTLSLQYVPEQYEFFEQKLLLEADGKSMQGDLYQPALDRSIPNYPKSSIPEKYTRVQ